MPGLLLDASDPKPTGTSAANSSSKSDSQWSFSFRGGGFQSDSDSSDSDDDGGGGDGNTAAASNAQDKDKQVSKDGKDGAARGQLEPTRKAALSDDAQLLRDLDIATRADADAAEFKANPWSIARVNAASRPAHAHASFSAGPGLAPDLTPAAAAKPHEPPPADARPGRGFAPPAAASASAAVSGKKADLKMKKRTIEGFFAAEKTNRPTNKPVGSIGERTDVKSLPPSHPFARPLISRRSPLKQTRFPTPISSGPRTVSALAPCAPYPTHVPTHAELQPDSQALNDLTYNDNANYTNESRNLDLEPGAAPISFWPDEEPNTSLLTDCPTPPRPTRFAPLKPSLYANKPSSGGDQKTFPAPRGTSAAHPLPPASNMVSDLNICAAKLAPFNSHKHAPAPNSQQARLQGPFSSPLRHVTGAYRQTTPPTNIATPQVNQTAAAKASASLTFPRWHGVRAPGLDDEAAPPPRKHGITRQDAPLHAFSSPAKYPTSDGVLHPGRAALGLSYAIPVPGTFVHGQDGGASDFVRYAAANEHTFSQTSHLGVSGACPNPRPQTADEDEEAPRDETEEKDRSAAHAAPLPAASFTSFVHPPPAARRALPPTPKPVRPAPSPPKRVRAAPDAYAALADEDGDAGWSTLPARKRAKNAGATKQSARFQLPIALPAALPSAPAARDGVQQQRVVTYLPPPRDVHVHAQAAPAARWSIKRVQHARGAVAGAGVKQEEEAAASESRPSDSSDAPTTLASSSTNTSTSSAPERAGDVSVAFDAARVARAYPGVRAAMLERKAAARALWDALGLASCGVPCRDAGPGGTRGRREIEIVFWRGCGVGECAGAGAGDAEGREA
ncbi:hypothetical protein DFH11DRAFT_1725705 [Phellopilus nigrolimitatus]|nr:hypothetical protein DFH11DRAFT_1725705 [Phellopilus nigrolimitatus]